MSQLKTAFIECPICKFLQETDSASVYNEITLKNTYGAEVVVSSSEVQDVVFCEKCKSLMFLAKDLKSQEKKLQKSA